MAVSFHLSLPFPFPRPLGFDRRNSVSQAEEFLTWSSPHQQSRRETQRTTSRLECMSLCPPPAPAGPTRWPHLPHQAGPGFWFQSQPLYYSNHHHQTY